MAETDRRPYSSSELQNINNQRLTGQIEDVGASQVSALPKISLPTSQVAGKSSWQQKIDQLKAGYQPSADVTDYTEEAARAGWGQSRYDAVNPYLPGQDIEEARALEQTSFNKVVSGLAKGGVTAATTAVNTVAGTVFGAGSSLFEMLARVTGNGNGQPGVAGVIDAGVNNWLSQRMINLQKASEEWFPNYKTEEERSEKYQKEWWKHMGTANFIGDSLLKNFGFTVGAMAGGMAWSKVLSRSLFKKMSGDILKASVLAAEGDSGAYTEIQRIAEAIRSGNIQAIDPNKLAVTLEQAARQINKADALLQLYGSAVAAMGEGTSEGLMARQEFDEDVEAQIRTSQQRDINSVREQILKDGDKRYVRYRQGVDDRGNPANIPYLTDAGEAEVYKRQSQYEQKYRRIRELAAQEGQRLATTTFLLNLPILTTSNLVQFGRMFSGGWQTARNTVSDVSGGIARKAVQKGTAEAAKRGGISWLADFGSKGNTWTKSILNSLKVAGSESFEEMSQGTVSAGAKNVAQDRILAAFNNDGYDVGAIDSVREWFSSMSEGGREYLGDIKNWQEGALGAITGLFGIPGKVWQSGNRWNGGLYQAIKDAKEEVGLSRESAATLNRLVNSEEFQDRWHSYIRHLAYDNRMQDAVVNDDQYAWQNNNDNQLINDVMAFAKAGRLEDLNQIVQAYGNMTAADASQLREALKQDASYAPVAGNDIRNMTDTEVVDRVKKQAERIAETITQYKRVHDALSVRLPIGTDKKLLDELVFTTMQIQNFEKRFLTMLDETLTALEPTLHMYELTSSKGETLQTKEEQQERFNELQNRIQRLFTAVGIPAEETTAVQLYIDNQLEGLKKMVKKHGDAAAIAKVEDMQKLAEARRAYYRKFQFLQTPKGAAQFTKQAVTQDDVNKKADEAYSKIETQGFQSIGDVRNAYLEKHDERDKVSFKDSLRKAAKDNPIAQQALDLIDTYEAFKIFADRRSYGVKASPIAQDLPAAGLITERHIADMLDYAFRNASSAAELQQLPDNLFKNAVDWVNSAGKFSFFGGAQIGYDADSYEAAKEIVRRLMDAYLKANNVTSTRTMSSKPVEHSQENEAKPGGTEPSQPASVNPAPTPPVMPDGVSEPEVKAPEATAPVLTVSEEQDLSPVAKRASEQELEKEADDASSESARVVNLANEEVEQRDESKLAYYNLGVPEIDVEQAEKARSGDRRGANLSDFYTLEPFINKYGQKITPANYEKIWRKIETEGGFDAVVYDASVGDEIEFVIYPKTEGDISFPMIGRNPEIVLRLKRTGQILNTLPARTSRFYNLMELRKAIMDEYDAWSAANPSADSVFVFSKTSRIWAKRSGQIDYDYAKEGLAANEKPITEVDGYREDAPVVFIDKHGQPITVSGTQQKGIPYNWGSTSLQERKGNLYYMVPNGNDSYIPIRLFVEHFTPENMNADNPVFKKVRDIITDIANLVRRTSSGNFNMIDMQKVNERLHSKLSELVPLIDLNHVWMQAGNYPNMGPALRIVTNVGVEGLEQESEPIYASEVTPERLLAIIAGMRPSIQIGAKKGSSFQDYIENGFITTNAKKLRPKGVDLYFDAWDGEKFSKVTPGQKAYADEQEAEKAAIAAMKSPDIPVQPEPVAQAPVQEAPISDNEDLLSDDDDDFVGSESAMSSKVKEETYKPEEVESTNPEPEETVTDPIADRQSKCE